MKTLPKAPFISGMKSSMSGFNRSMAASGLRSSIARSGQGSRFSGSSVLSGSETVLMEKNMKAQERILKAAHKTEIRNVKNLAMQDASDYVRDSTDKLIKALS